MNSISNPKALPCLINGCDPNGDTAAPLGSGPTSREDWSHCKWCNALLHRNKMWGGTSWKITWSRICIGTSAVKGET